MIDYFDFGIKMISRTLVKGMNVFQNFKNGYFKLFSVFPLEDYFSPSPIFQEIKATILPVARNKQLSPNNFWGLAPDVSFRVLLEYVLLFISSSKYTITA